MIKAVLFDGDGVAIITEMMFSEKYSKEFGVDHKKLEPIFQEEFQDCMRGKKDFKEIFPKYQKEWGWRKSIDGLLKYWHESEDYPNKDVLRIVRQLRENGIKCYLVSNQEKYRKDYIKSVMNFDNKFDDLFFSCDVGYLKKDKVFFEEVLKIIKSKEKIDKKEVMHWDDSEKEVNLAKEFGLDSYLYKNAEEMKSVLKDKKLL